MKTCPDCGFEAKNASGLAAHRRARHPRAERQTSSVVDSVREDLERSHGPAAMKASALQLAHAIDQTSSARDLASLIRELRATMVVLAPEEAQQADAVDEVAARRARRRAEAADSARTTPGQ